MKIDKEEKLKKYIESPDFIISASAIEYFNEIYSEDEEIIEYIIKALNKHENHFERNYILAKCKNINIIDEKWSELLKLSKNDEIFNINLASLMVTKGLDIIEKFYDEISNAFAKRKELKKFDIFKYVNTLRNMKESSTEELLKLLKDYVDENAKTKITEFNLTYGMCITNELKLRNDLNYDFIRKQLYKTKNDYYKVYLIEILSELRDEKFIELLIKELNESNYLLNEEICRALAKINSNKVIEKIKEVYGDTSENIKIYLTMVFDRIKTSFSECVCFELLKNEKNYSIRSILASQLCRMYSKESIDYIYNMIKNNEYDETLVNLKRALYVNAKVNNVEFEEMESWRKNIDMEMEKIENAEVYLSFAI